MPIVSEELAMDGQPELVRQKCLIDQDKKTPRASSLLVTFLYWFREK